MLGNDITTRDIRSLDTAVDNIVGAEDDMGLQLNISKTKYMFSTKNKSQSQLTCSLSLGSRKFEVVKEFIYLGTQITADNNISAEIRRRITLASRCLYGLSIHLRSKMLSRTTKLKLYNALIVPVLIYGAEAWTLTDSDERTLDMFERKV